MKKKEKTMEKAALFESIFGFVSKSQAGDILPGLLEAKEYSNSVVDKEDESSGEPVYTRQQQRDIQGNIIPGFKKDYQCFLFFQIEPGKVGATRDFLQWLEPQVTNMQEVLAFKKLHKKAKAETGLIEPAALPELGLSTTWTNVAFSYQGMVLLLGEIGAAGFKDEAFVNGMSQRSGVLGDPQEANHPGNIKNWKFGGSDPTHEVHVMVTIAADLVEDRDDKAERICERAKSAGLRLVYQQQAKAMPEPLKGHEHFGFKDGISDPAVRGRVELAGGKKEYISARYIDGSKEDTAQNNDLTDRSQYFAKPGQQLVWPGQFLVGEPRQAPYKLIGEEPEPDPNFPEWAKLGSYLVCRRLDQDVDSFWNFANDVACKMKLDKTHLAAQMVGRWPSGAPIMRHPENDDIIEGDDSLRNNHFLFDAKTRPIHLKDGAGEVSGNDFDDWLGLVCPHFAHIRKVHTRDSPTDLGPIPDMPTRMILRRGIPYGESVWQKDGTIREDADDESRGLMFICYNTSIVNQFEFISNRWSNSPVQPNLGGHDPIIGQTHANGGTRFIDVPYKDNKAPLGYSFERVEIDQQFVTPTGGEYFFSPPISSLKSNGALGELKE